MKLGRVTNGSMAAAACHRWLQLARGFMGLGLVHIAAQCSRPGIEKHRKKGQTNYLLFYGAEDQAVLSGYTLYPERFTVL